MNNVLTHIQQLEAAMNENFISRQEEIHGILLAMIAKKNMLLIGPPGVAKSSVIQQFVDSFENINSFTRLISKTTQPDELFGSAKFDRLKEGVIERQVAGHLPTAHFAFLDEIFKSTSDLLNGLLKIMNEHRFENGTKTIQSPLFTVIGASNEFPEDDDLAALYDRFLIRREVESLKTPAHLLEMLLMDEQKEVPPLTLAMIEELQRQALAVDVPTAIMETLVDIHFRLRELGIVVSDRRTKQCVSVLKAEALLRGRHRVEVNDLAVLKDCLWIEAEDRQAVWTLLQEYLLTPLDHAFERGNDFATEIETQVTQFERQDDFSYKVYTEYASNRLQDWRTLECDIEELIEIEADRQRLETLKARIETSLTKVLM